LWGPIGFGALIEDSASSWWRRRGRTMRIECVLEEVPSVDTKQRYSLVMKGAGTVEECNHIIDLLQDYRELTNTCKVCDGRTDYFNLPYCPGCGRKLSRDPLAGMGLDLEDLNICGDRMGVNKDDGL